MEIGEKDKINLEEELFCPPHCLPHKRPFTKPITNERCHLHKQKRHMLHHQPFCKLTKCPNYKKMIATYKKYKEEKTLE
jgi:hypothetical protein